MRLVGMFLPLQDEPDHRRRESRRTGIDLRLDRRKPERIAEHIDEGTCQSRGLYDHGLCPCRYIIACHEPPHKVGNGKKKQHDAERTEQRAEHIHRVGHTVGRRDEARNDIRHEHEERSSGRMARLQLMTGKNELGAIPERGTRLHRQAIDHGSYHKHKPTQEAVGHAVRLFRH